MKSQNDTTITWKRAKEFKSVRRQEHKSVTRWTSSSGVKLQNLQAWNAKRINVTSEETDHKLMACSVNRMLGTHYQ
jgi:hypothetical protein